MTTLVIITSNKSAGLVGNESFCGKIIKNPTEAEAIKSLTKFINDHHLCTIYHFTTPTHNIYPSLSVIRPLLLLSLQLRLCCMIFKYASQTAS